LKISFRIDASEFTVALRHQNSYAAFATFFFPLGQWRNIGIDLGNNIFHFGAQGASL